MEILILDKLIFSDRSKFNKIIRSSRSSQKLSNNNIDGITQYFKQLKQIAEPSVIIITFIKIKANQATLIFFI